MRLIKWFVEYNNLDYGHIMLNRDEYGQEYISWYGLISIILFWEMFEVVSGLLRSYCVQYVFHVWRKIIIWPDDSIVLVAKLLNYLREKDLYIEVSW